MSEYKEIAKWVIKHVLGEERFQEICQRFGLTSADEELLSQMLNEWKPDSTFDDAIFVCKNYERYPNIEKVMQAWEAMAVEAARNSTLGRLQRKRN